MASPIAEAFVRVRPDTRGFRHEAERDVGGAMRETAKRAVEAFAIVEGARKSFEFLSDATKDAAQTEKAMELVKRTFGGASEEVIRFSEHADRGLGLSAQAALGMTGQMGNLLRNMGLGRKAVGEFSIELTKRAADLASVFPKLTAEEALGKLRSGIAGQTRGLKQLGIVISTSDLQAEALRDHLVAPVRDAPKILSAQDALTRAQVTLGKAIQQHGAHSLEARLAQDRVTQSTTRLQTVEAGSIPQLTQAQRARAALNLVLDKTSRFSGAAARDDSLIQQQRRLSAEWTNAKEVIGQALLPVVSRLIGFIGRQLPAVTEILTGIVHTAIGAFEGLYRILGPYLQPVVEAITRALRALSHGGFDAGIDSLTASARRLVGWFSTLSDGGKVLTGILVALGAALLIAFAPVTAIVLAIAGLAAGVVYAYTHFEGFRRVVQDVVAWIEGPGVAGFRRFSTYVVGEVRKIIAFFVAKWPDIQRAIERVITVAMALWRRFGPTIIALVQNAVNTLRRLFQDVVTIVENTFALVIDLINGDWGKAWDDAKRIVRAALDGVWALIKGEFNGARLVLTALGKAALDGLIAGLRGVGRLVWAALRAGFTFVTSTAPAWIYRQAVQLGKNLVDGIVDGTTGLAGRLGSSLKSNVTGALSDVGSAFGIGSPSRVTRDRIGIPLQQGIIEGLKGLDATAKASLQQQLHDAVQGAQQQLTTLGGNLASTLGTAIDATTARRQAGLARDPRQQRITAIQAQLDAEQRAADRQQRLSNLSSAQQALAGATDPAAIAQAQQQLADAQRAISDQALQDEQAKLQTSLDREKANIDARATARKDAATRGINDLTAELNAGQITQTTFLRRLQRLLRGQAPEYRQIGRLLGFAAQQGFQAQLSGLIGQSAATSQALRRFGGAGLGVTETINDPIAAIATAVAQARQSAAQARASAATSRTSAGTYQGIGAAASGTGSYAAGALAAGGGRAGSAAADVVRTAQRLGLSHAETLTLIATGLQESGLSYGAVGDHGDSVGPFQYNIHGAGAGKSTAWRESIQEVIAEASRWHGVTSGAAAAAVQKPYDRAGYAMAVDALISSGRAEAIYRQFAGLPAAPGAPGAPRHVTAVAPDAVAAARADLFHHGAGAARYVNIEHMNITSPHPGETAKRVVQQLDHTARTTTP